MNLIGFSLDNLSLMALTISTGFVVDDAIVMIENIVRFIEMGDPPMEAALKGAEQIGFTVISLSISLIAVFIPLLFMTGIVGRLFREFAITLSISIVISAVVSLTLTPMMCAKLLKHTPKDQQTWFYRKSEKVFEGSIAFYGRARMDARPRMGNADGCDRHAGADDRALHRRAQGLFPVQDTGVIQGVSEAPQNDVVRGDGARAAGFGADILQDPAVESLSSFVGIEAPTPRSTADGY